MTGITVTGIDWYDSDWYGYDWYSMNDWCDTDSTHTHGVTQTYRQAGMLVLLKH